jgi:hypothetical protein
VVSSTVLPLESFRVNCRVTTLFVEIFMKLPFCS